MPRPVRLACARCAACRRPSTKCPPSARRRGEWYRRFRRGRWTWVGNCKAGSATPPYSLSGGFGGRFLRVLDAAGAGPGEHLIEGRDVRFGGRDDDIAVRAVTVR